MTELEQVKEKKEFQEFPDSLILRVLELKEVKKLSGKEKIKQARAVLRKYFSVFLSNKIVSGKLSAQETLAKHISSKDRDYSELYNRIVGEEDVIFDLGAGVNGLSYGLIGKRYVALEATEVLVEIMNKYFRENKYNAIAIQKDLFELDSVLRIIEKENGRKVVWMFNVIDALELEPNYSKKFISAVIEKVDKIVLSWPTQSLQKKRKFAATRNWMIGFIEDNYKILDEFEMNGEKFVCFSKQP